MDTLQKEVYDSILIYSFPRRMSYCRQPPMLAFLASPGLSAHLHARSSTHPEQCHRPWSSQQPRMGRALETVCSHSANSHCRARPHLSVGRGGTEDLHAVSEEWNPHIYSNVMANGNAASLCSQLHLCKLRWQPMYCRVIESPPN